MAPETQEQIPFGQFDLILANPPFGINLAVNDPNRLQQQYQLGRRWIQRSGSWQTTAILLKRQQIQLLFLERCLELLRAGGRLGLLLPDGNLSNPADRYIREYIAEKAAVLGAVGLPPGTFQPYAGIKASALFLEKQGIQRSIFIAVAPTAGRDTKGWPLYKEDPAPGQEVLDDAVSEIARLYHCRENSPQEETAPAIGYQIQPED